jgi:hypothetical protein
MNFKENFFPPFQKYSTQPSAPAEVEGSHGQLALYPWRCSPEALRRARITELIGRENAFIVPARGQKANQQNDARAEQTEVVSYREMIRAEYTRAAIERTSSHHCIGNDEVEVPREWGFVVGAVVQRRN